MSWQGVATFVVVLFAMLIMTRRVRRLVKSRKSGGCDGCGSRCRTPPTVNALPLVSLGSGPSVRFERDPE